MLSSVILSLAALTPAVPMDDYLERAISRGVPLFNSGQAAACAAVYATALEAVAENEGWPLGGDRRRNLRFQLELAEAVAGLPNLKLRGLMCLPEIRSNFEEQRVPFRRLAELAVDLKAAGIETDTLSMGMTGDYRAAIFEGATIVRIGTAIFGPRPPANT